MAKIDTKRMAIKLGGSLYVCLPSLFAKANEIKEGDKIQIKGNLKCIRIQKVKAGSKPA